VDSVRVERGVEFPTRWA